MNNTASHNWPDCISADYSGVLVILTVVNYSWEHKSVYRYYVSIKHILEIKVHNAASACIVSPICYGTAKT